MRWWYFDVMDGRRLQCTDVSSTQVEQVTDETNRGRPMKILLVEDSERLVRSLERGLTKVGYTVDSVSNGIDAIALAETYHYDAMVLDLMIPGMSGLNVLRSLRRKGCDTHTLILSAKDQVSDRIEGLKSGADDYLIKPFSFDELCARLEALVRRSHHHKNPILSVGPLRIDTALRLVSKDGQEVRLTPSEYNLLVYLAYRSGRVVSQDQLLEHLYRSDTDVSSNVIEVLVSSLRRKIHELGKPPIVRTRRGFGYFVE